MRPADLLARFRDRVMTSATARRLQWKWRYIRWRLTGTGSYSAQYVEQVSADIAAGKRHGTLSTILDDPDGARRSAAFVAETAAQHGLQAGAVCIEFGCGALRIGEHLMRLVGPGKYVGLDVTDRFWRNGIERVGADFIAEHRPTLEVIDGEVSRWARANARVVVCIAVMIHVPPPELDAFVARLASVLGPETTLLLDARLGKSTRQVHFRTWEHSRSRMRQLFARHSLEPLLPEPVTRTGLAEQLWVLRKAPTDS